MLMRSEIAETERERDLGFKKGLDKIMEAKSISGH